MRGFEMGIYWPQGHAGTRWVSADTLADGGCSRMETKRRTYEAPAVTGTREFESRAVGCGKIPGLGDTNFCDVVWASPHGNQAGCVMNPPSVSRSS